MRTEILSAKRSAKRSYRVRSKLRRQRETGNGRLRLSVHRSNLHIEVQLINDETGTTLVAASSKEKGLREQFKNGGSVKVAEQVGQLVAQRASEKGLTENVVFDRGSFLYHGRIKALADAARAAGMKF